MFPPFDGRLFGRFAERKDGRGVEAIVGRRGMHARTDGASVARRLSYAVSKNHAFDMRVNVEGRRTQESD